MWLAFNIGSGKNIVPSGTNVDQMLTKSHHVDMQAGESKRPII